MNTNHSWKLVVSSGLVLFAISLNAQVTVEPIIREPVRTVASVDLNKYLGRWYEIASIPQRFSKGCHCTTADYSLRSDGSLRVVNTCRRGGPEGKLTVASGRASAQDETNSKLKVGFFLSKVPWVRNLFSGDYWITALSPTYDYAVISNRKGSSMWILSRTPQLATAIVEELVATSRASINVGALQIQNQIGCTYPNR